MKRLSIPFGIIGLMLCLVGCRDQASSEDDVLVVINGQPLTAEYVRTAVRIEAKMAELAGRPAAKNFPKWGNDRGNRMVPEIMNALLIGQAFKKCNIKPTTNDVAKALAYYNGQTGLSVASKEELCAKFGELKDAFSRQFDLSVALIAYRRIYWEYKASDLLVEDHIRRMGARRAECERVDKAAKEKADKAYDRLLNGESWEKVADELSEDRLCDPEFARYAKDWRWMGLNNVADKGLVKCLMDMKVGDITPPVEINEGLVIARVIGRQEDVFHLARIFFRMSMPIPKFKDKADARRNLEEAISESTRATDMDRLQKQATFEFPRGTNFVYKLWKED